MSIFGREKLAKASSEFTEILNTVENIRALQAAQRDIADSVKRLADRIQALEIEFRVIKAEVRAEALRETQSIVNAVQGQFYKSLQDVAVNVAILREQTRAGNDPAARLGATLSDGGETPRIPP